MRARHRPDPMAGGVQDRCEHGAGGALAVGAGYERAGEPAFRVARSLQDGPAALQAELHPEPSQARDVLQRLLVGQLRRSAARSVFRTSIARVIGPTPPGLGVSQPATWATAGSTSPTRRPSRRFTPTSITVAPGRTQSGPM